MASRDHSSGVNVLINCPFDITAVVHVHLVNVVELLIFGYEVVLHFLEHIELSSKTPHR